MTETPDSTVLRALAQQKFDEWYESDPVPGEEDSLSYDYVREIVPDLLNELDALRAEKSTLNRNWLAKWNEAREAAEAERDALRRIIAEAPHTDRCASNEPRVDLSGWPPCDCWKSQIEETR